MLRLPLTSTVLALALAGTVSWGLAPGFAWAQERAPVPPAPRAMEKPTAAPAKPTAAPARPRVTTPVARPSPVQAPKAQAQQAPEAPAAVPETHEHSSPLHNRPPAPAIRAAVREFVARRPPVPAATPASVSAPRYVVSWPTRKVTLRWPTVPERTTLTWPLASSAPVDVGRGPDSAPSAISTGRPR